jgi:hypothetical protein
MYFLLFVVAAIGGGFYFFLQYQKDKEKDVVPTGYVAWDGLNAYPAGSPLPEGQIKFVDIEERITTFGVDVLGLISVIDTSTDESGHVAESGYNDKGHLEKNTLSRRSGNQTVTTRQSAEFKNRYVIVWKPDTSRIRQFLKSGNVPDRIAELLRTMPDVDLAEYAELLGIEIVRFTTPPKKETSGVELGDGVEIPY